MSTQGQGSERPVEFSCFSCGYTGVAVANVPDEIQCPMCGEPVFPMPGY